MLGRIRLRNALMVVYLCSRPEILLAMFQRLRSNTIVVRDKGQILPIPSEVNNRLKSISREDKGPVSCDST